MYNELREVEVKDDMGYVYILYNNKSNLVKIGRTKSPHKRFTTLTNQNGTDFKYYISNQMYIDKIIEKIMHSKFHIYRKKGEWFLCEFDSAVKELEELINSEDFKRRNISK